MILDPPPQSATLQNHLIKILQMNLKSCTGTKKISERFSSSKKIIHYVMNEGQEDDENLKKGIGAFVTDDLNYKKAIEEIRSAPSVHRDIQQVNRLMSSYLHMFMNRMFVSNQRKVELVIYDYLLKYYESKIAREINKNKIAEVAEVNSINEISVYTIGRTRLQACLP
jgi:hypothetical protein